MDAKTKQKSKMDKPKQKTCRKRVFREKNGSNGSKSKIMTKQGVLSNMEKDLDNKFKALCSTDSVEISDTDKLRAEILNTFESLGVETWRVELKGKVFETLTRYRKLRSGSEFHEIDLEAKEFLGMLHEVFSGFELIPDPDSEGSEEPEEVNRRKPKEVTSLFDGLARINDVMDKEQKRAPSPSDML